MPAASSTFRSRVIIIRYRQELQTSGCLTIPMNRQDQLESLSILGLPCTGQPPTVKVPVAGPARPSRMALPSLIPAKPSLIQQKKGYFCAFCRRRAKCPNTSFPAAHLVPGYLEYAGNARTPCFDHAIFLSPGRNRPCTPPGSSYFYIIGSLMNHLIQNLTSEAIPLL